MKIIVPITFAASMLVSSNIVENDNPAWGSATYGIGSRVMYNHRNYESADNQSTVTVDKQSTVTISIAAPGVVTWNAHGLTNGTRIRFLSTGDLPTGITAGETYFVSGATTNTFNLSTKYAGSTIATTGTQSGTHTAYVTNTNPETSNLWIDLGATNKFAAFDDRFGTQSKATSTVTFTLQPNAAIDSIAILNCTGSEVTVSSTCAGMTPYSKTIKLTTDLGVFDWSSYFFAPIVAEKDVVITDLKPFLNQVIVVTITGSGTVGIGNISMGRVLDLGELEYSPKIGITDFSKKETDSIDGSLFLKEGNYAKRFSGSIIVPNDFVDQLAGMLASLRATLVIWIGAHYSSLVVWGYYKEFEIDLKHPSVSYCSIYIEGLV